MAKYFYNPVVKITEDNQFEVFVYETKFRKTKLYHRLVMSEYKELMKVVNKFVNDINKDSENSSLFTKLFKIW